MFGGLGDKWYKQLIGPLQLAIHVVHNHHAGEQKSHWERTNKHLKLCVPFVCLVPEPHEWQTAKGLFLTAQEIQIISIPRFLINNWLYLVCKKLCSNNGGTLYSPPPPRPLEKKERKISEVKFNFTYRPSWSGESYCDAFCWKSRWNWPLEHSQQVFAFPYAISLIRVRFKQFRKGDHLTAICIKYYLITENSLKTMPNFTEKGWAEAPSVHP